MKFSTIAFALFVSGVSALPEDFQEQCCGGALGPVDIPAGFSLENNVAGYSADECIDEVGTNCVSMYELCADLSYPAGITGVLDSTGLLCINPDAEPGSVPLDNPWSCATVIGWQGFPSEAGPVATATGYMCGRVQLCKDTGVVCGDPHFQTWSGDWYDFHGECDMKFLEIPEFGNGLGLTVDIRAKARYEYSYIESAALKIGDDILEVSSYGSYLLNGVESANVNGAKLADIYRIEHEIKDTAHHIFTIYTGHDDEAIVIKTFKDLVAVKMQNAFPSTFSNAIGMLGDYMEGTRLARDGKTIIEDDIEFGMEWQVRSDEPNLFQTASPVSGKCIMPSADASDKRRRLGETVPLEAAVAACEAVDHVHPENCVYDVMATGDLDIAMAGVF